MIYLVVGSNFNERKQYTNTILEAMSTKRPEAQILTLDSESLVIGTFGQYISGIGLFDEKSIIKLLGVCENTETKQYLFENLHLLHESDNAFVFSENKLTKPELSKFEKLGVKIKICDENSAPTNGSMFDIADLLLQQKKSALLVRYYEYLNSGTSAEELVGILLWQTKSLNLALNYPIEQTGLKPFVYNKCLKSKWNKESAQELYFNIINQYHESRRGGLTLRERIEKIILKI